MKAHRALRRAKTSRAPSLRSMLRDRANISWYGSPHGCRGSRFPLCGHCGIRQSRILFLLEQNIYTEVGRISSQP